MRHYTPEQIRNAEEILFNAEGTARLALMDSAYQIEQLEKRLDAAEKALRRAEQTIRNAALGFAEGDARTILLNEASNCAAALKEKP